MAREGMTEKEARQRIAKADKERSTYYNQAAQSKWGEPGTYDLCVNTDRMPVEAAVRLIVNAAK